MGDLLPFRKRPKTWTRPEDYGHVLSALQWGGEPPRRNILVRFWRAIRWWLGIVVIAALWVLYRNAIAYDPPAFLEGQPVAVPVVWPVMGPAAAPTPAPTPPPTWACAIGPLASRRAIAVVETRNLVMDCVPYD